MEIWKKLKQVPPTALKEIQAGRLKGKSDINPQWRYQAVTEIFGICGIGWKYTIDKKWTEQGANGEICCFADISFYIKHNGEWSEAIPANGGSMFVANERNGAYTSDECYKMAITDALGTAMKMIGVAADIYLGQNVNYGTKYEAKPQAEIPKAELKWLNLFEKDGKPNEKILAHLTNHFNNGFSLIELEGKVKINSKEKEFITKQFNLV
jgi:hypothetical protein